ncbi:unnamed protein product, partial [Polarella glacialis]
PGPPRHPPPPPRHPPPVPPPPGQFNAVAVGRVVRYEEAKGYGFIAPEDGGEEIFFLRSELPPELASCTRREQIMDIHAEFEVTRNSDGKLRAKKMVLLYGSSGGSSSSSSNNNNTNNNSSSSRSTGLDRPGLNIGTIMNYDAKGFGFIKSDHIAEDIFFLRSELPPELDGREPRRDEVVDKVVEFEVRTMPDGKLRAERLQFPHGRPSGGRAPEGKKGIPVSGTFIGKIRRFDRSK